MYGPMEVSDHVMPHVEEVCLLLNGFIYLSILSLSYASFKGSYFTLFVAEHCCSGRK